MPVRITDTSAPRPEDLAKEAMKLGTNPISVFRLYFPMPVGLEFPPPSNPDMQGVGASYESLSHIEIVDDDTVRHASHL